MLKTTSAVLDDRHWEALKRVAMDAGMTRAMYLRSLMYTAVVAHDQGEPLRIDNAPYHPGPHGVSLPDGVELQMQGDKPWAVAVDKRGFITDADYFKTRLVKV